MPCKFDYDVFVSYAAEEGSIAVQIAEFLQSQGLQVWFDRWNMQPGDNVLDAIRRGLKASKRAIICISKHYSTWTIFESTHFLTRDKSLGRDVIPVRIDNAKLPSFCSGLSWIDWSAGGETLQRLLDASRDRQSNLERNDSTGRKSRRAHGTGALTKKLDKLDQSKKRGRQLPIVLLGGVYLDFHIRPVATTVLTGDEYAHLQPISTELGGSAVQVGQDLKKIYGKTSHLVSVISGIEGDLLARQCKEFLEKEDWIIKPGFVRKGTLPPATTVILHQSTHSFNTMFTHTGVLAELTWEMANDSVQQALDSGGILYISAFFKSKLWLNLHENLRMLGSSIVVIDHGRLMPGFDSQPAILTLADAFQRKLIDVYICTSRELWDLMSVIDGVQWEPQDDTKSALETIAQRDILPNVTFVRTRRVHSDIQSETYEAYCIIGKKVVPLRSGAASGNPVAAVRPGAVVKNIFNAAVLRAIAVGPWEGNLEKRFIEVGQSALQQCQALT